MAALQNGTAFFASTSLIAIGGALTLLRSSERYDRARHDTAARRIDVVPAVGGHDRHVVIEHHRHVVMEAIRTGELEAPSPPVLSTMRFSRASMRRIQVSR